MTMSARRNAPTAVPPWLRWVGHSGYVAEGVVYVLIGAFALVAAFEPSQQPNGYKGALAKLAAASFGDTMLALLALGLAAFVLWQERSVARCPRRRSGVASVRVRRSP